jgi:hypothetical protein
MPAVFHVDAFLCVCVSCVALLLLMWFTITTALPPSAATGGGVAAPSRSPEDQTELRRKIYRAELAREQLETQVRPSGRLERENKLFFLGVCILSHQS